MGDLTKNFNKEEFVCKCGCGLYNMNPEVIEDLQRFRTWVDRPVIITSGSRCPYHNHVEGGTNSSAHLTGDAVDIAAPNSKERFDVVQFFVDLGYQRIGIGKTFVHVDLNKDNPQDVIWLY